VELQPRYAEAHYNLGNALKDAGDLDAACNSWRRAVELNPKLPEAHGNLANVLRNKGDINAAIAAYRQAIALNPTWADAHSNLGLALKDKGEVDAAIAACRKAIELKPDHAEAHNNLAVALRERGDLDEAIAEWNRAIAIRPDYADAHFNLALGLLLKGDWQRGWEEHEWRWKVSRLPPPRPFSQPCWKGEDVKRKTVLIHAEQGYGDAIQFLRYVPMLAERGARVIVEVQPELKRLADGLPGAAQVVERGAELPKFDFYCPMVSLPRGFATTPETIPAGMPYLSADAKITERWRTKFEGSPPALKVGLAWAGSPTHRNDRNRSIALSQLSPLANVKGAAFFSLQKGAAAIRTADFCMIDWISDLTDFAETAGLIANLDLVISVDTAVAHLAGAMGKPIWMLLPFMPDWRWLRDRSETPWYSRMRLFRQKRRGDWNAVIAEVAAALKERAKP